MDEQTTIIKLTSRSELEASLQAEAMDLVFEKHTYSDYFCETLVNDEGKVILSFENFCNFYIRDLPEYISMRDFKRLFKRQFEEAYEKQICKQKRGNDARVPGHLYA